MTKTEIVQELRRVSQEMKDLGAAMDYYAGLNDAEMAQHGREMVGAGCIAESWADAIEGDIYEAKNA